mgnify:CR=1 FL=1
MIEKSPVAVPGASRASIDTLFPSTGRSIISRCVTFRPVVTLLVSSIGASLVTRTPPSPMIGSIAIAAVSAPMAPASQTITDRSITFSSSRTLPGQRWRRSASVASGVNPSTARPPRATAAARKWSARSGMSAVRSRSGGISIVITFTRQKRSARKRPSATSRSRHAKIQTLGQSSANSNSSHCGEM